MTTFYGQPTPDRSPHWVSPKGLEFNDDCLQCPDAQKEVCYDKSQENVENVIGNAKKALTKIGYADLEVTSSTNVPNTLLVLGGSLLFEELVYVKEQTGWYVDNLPSLGGIKYRTIESIVNDLGLNQEMIRDFILVGQEWHVIVQGIESEQVGYLERWFRSRNRHRVHVLRLEEICELGIEEAIEMFMYKSNNYQQEDYFREHIVKLL